MNPIRIGLIIAALTAASCSPEAEEGATSEPAATVATSADAAPGAEAQQAALERGQIHEPPPLFDGAYAPVSRTAMSITDALNVGGNEIQFGLGHVYRTEPVRMATAAEIAAFKAVGSHAEASAFEVRKVTEELVNARAPNGGLCRPEATTFIVLGAALDADGHTEAASMLAYKGVTPPTAATAEQDLCGTFLYTREEAAE